MDPAVQNIVSSILLAAAAGWLAWQIVDIITCTRTVDPALGRFEVDRREQLRTANSLYRLFEPWIDELKQRERMRPPELREEIRENLVASGESELLTAEEYLAICKIRGVLIGLIVGLLVYLLGGMTMGLIAAAMTIFVYPGFARRGLQKRADMRRKTIKRRFSAMVDLMALMMEVGGTIQQSLEVVARESRGHPLGDELQLLLNKLNGGTPRREAFRSFGARISDDDITELVTSVVEGERLGTPLTKILRTQADLIRRKRSQWAEKAAQEAQVAIVGPAMVIMVACLITVAAPFVLDAMATFGG